MSELRKMSLEQLACNFRNTDYAITGQPVRYGDYIAELRRRDEAVAALVITARDAADMLEDHYRRALGLASKKEKDAWVRDHAVLAPLRSALSALEGQP